MVRQALRTWQRRQSRGYRYIGITDHAKGLKIASGLDERRLQQQGEEIQKVNQSLAAQNVEFTVSNRLR